MHRNYERTYPVRYVQWFWLTYNMRGAEEFGMIEVCEAVRS